MRIARAALVAAAATAVAAATGIGPASATPAPVPPPAVPAAATAAPADRPLTPEQLRAQIAAARQLREDLLSSNAQIAAATTRLEKLSTQANALLQDYAKARDAERAARQDAAVQLAAFERLNAQLTEDRQTLGQWAFQAYTGGGSLADMASLLESLDRQAEEAIDPLAHLGYITDERVQAYERVQDHVAAQRDIAAKAVEATTRAREATTKATAAKEKLDAVIADQRAQLDATRALHEAQAAKAAPISGLLLGTGTKEALEATNSLRQALRLPAITPAQAAQAACSGDERPYPNGKVPAAALCPLLGAPGESLRPAAAAAFNALTQAYQRDTGSPLCVTDSYRSYVEQVAVKSQRGRWAATPGTSEHGNGRALDLCGGVENFGGAAHLWMQQNAPLYGWFHPDWAGPSGSLPEPWHWEYAG